MTDRFKIYVADHKGYELITVLYEMEDVRDFIDNLDGNKYISYLVVKHNIKSNTDEVVDFGYTDYNVKKRKKVKENKHGNN